MTIEPRHLLLLLNWMSPAFPTGAFAYSHGLEWAIAAGDVTNADDMRDWAGELLSRGSGWNDAVLFARCWHEDADELNELALALASSRERHLETTQLGQAFAAAATVFLPPPSPASRATYRPRGEVSYAIAAGSACAAAGIEKSHALLACLQGFVTALTSVAVRLVPLGQTRGLAVLRDLMPVIEATAARAASATLDDLGTITLASEIAAMNHETLSPRIFRT